MKRVVSLQSNYIPWKGYFDLVHDADLFIFHDDLQYTRHDWRNRNKIKTPEGAQWLTIPVGPRESRLICQVSIDNSAWQANHWSQITQHYGKRPFFSRYKSFFDEFFLGQAWNNLSNLNQYLIRGISKEFLNLKTEFDDSRNYDLAGHKLDRLLELLGKAGSDLYISGPAAKDYIDPSRFAAAGIELRWKDYSGYPAYAQRFPPFEHGVSILDLLFNVGPDAPWYIWGWREGTRAP